MARLEDPVWPPPKRTHVSGDFSREELALANRNPGLPLEALRHGITPIGLHYLLAHFDVPFVAAPERWRLEVSGRVRKPLELSVEELRTFPVTTLAVTLECAGNGRAEFDPRWQSLPWEHGGVGTARWTGTPLRHVLERAGLETDAADIAFHGADLGLDGGTVHAYGRSLVPSVAMTGDVLIAWAMNGAPLPPQHGFPLRLVVPGWYGMASVKWLDRIEVLAAPFQGYQQAANYHYREKPGGAGTPVTTMRVKSLMAPPGIPDWYSRQRLVEAGPVELMGRAWSGAGEPIARMEVAIDGRWSEASLDPPLDKYAWRGWRFQWDASPGTHVLACRATDRAGNTQPLEPPWDNAGFGNNALHRIAVTVG
jgi:DMSO/TMAO reductase YedYZ molybdopterin-dependent catalytic subunit